MANPSVHYLGVVGTAGNADHARCAAQWERIKSERSNEYGPDGAYNFGACIHGERFIGRGWDRDSAANGVQDGINYNPGSRAICALVGTDDAITPELERAIADFATEAVEQHGLDWPLRPHSSYVATACPGDGLRDFIDRFNSGARPSVDAPAPTPKGKTMYCAVEMIWNEKSQPVASGKAYLISPNDRPLRALAGAIDGQFGVPSEVLQYTHPSVPCPIPTAFLSVEQYRALVGAGAPA